MGCWGHPPRWRVKNGEDRPYRVHDPTNSEGSARNPGSRRYRSWSPGAVFCSAWRLLACCRSGAVDDRDQVAWRHDPHDLMLGCDPQRARRTILPRVGQPDHLSSKGSRRRSIADHRRVVAGLVGSVIVGIDNRDVPRRRVPQTAEDGGEQPRSHRDKHLESRLR